MLQKQFQTIERAVIKSQYAIIGWFSFTSAILLGLLPASAQNSGGGTSSGFGDTISQVKGNAIISGAGQAAQDAILFPFIIVGIILLLALLALGVISIVALFSGRDIATPIINLAGAFAVLLMVNAMLAWIASSGLLG
jgi:hypothetical protein